MTLGHRIRQLRRVNEMRQQDLASALGCYQQTINRLERVATARIPADILPRLIQVLGVPTIDALFEGVDEYYPLQRKNKPQQMTAPSTASNAVPPRR